MQAKEQEAASNAQVKQLRSKRLPTLGVQAAAQHVEGYDAAGDDLWSITTRIQVPLWDGGGRRADVAKAEAARRAAQSSYLAKKLQARTELEAAIATWKASEKRYRSAVSGVSLATETSRIQSDRFSNGRISAADLVDAEAALAKARSAESSALADWWAADDALRLAAGKAPKAYNKTLEENQP
ncbi:MAG: hypothetical protein DSZ33_05940 [Gammaproteobacteria bacterium]|nr:MAG: hypothetical protein DSZ33_05940 [Gammaproteobacteria bacterium]